MPGFPTLDDLRKKIPAGGLMNPGLRRIKPSIARIRPLRRPSPRSIGRCR